MFTNFNSVYDMRLFAALLLIMGCWGVYSPVQSQEVSPDENKTLVQITPSEENVVASELFGEWIADNVLSARLCGGIDHTGNKKIVFRKNPQAEKRIAVFVEEILREANADQEEQDAQAFRTAVQNVYLAGEVEFNNKKQDFALISIYGSPRLIFFDRVDDMETGNVMLARDEAGDNDLLFLGGDFNNQSFQAYKRFTESSNEPRQ